MHYNEKTGINIKKLWSILCIKSSYNCACTVHQILLRRNWLHQMLPPSPQIINVSSHSTRCNFKSRCYAMAMQFKKLRKWIYFINQYQLTIWMISFSFKVLLLLNVGIHCYVEDGGKEIVRAGYRATLLCSVRDNF